MNEHEAIPKTLRRLPEVAHPVFLKFVETVQRHPPVPEMRADCVNHLCAFYAAMICDQADFAQVELRAYKNCMGYDD